MAETTDQQFMGLNDAAEQQWFVQFTSNYGDVWH